MVKISELVDEAHRAYPDVSIVVHDITTYGRGKKPERTVIARVTSSDYGQGSAEDIVLRMSVADHGLGPDVIRVIPGKTSLFWQVEPLVRSLEKLTPHAEYVGVGGAGARIGE